MTISITGEEGSHLALEVRNPTTPGEPVIAGSGMGLMGLAERVELSGGHLEFEESGGFFAVKARLNWRTA